MPWLIKSHIQFSESRIGKRRSNSLGVLPDKRIKRREDNMLEQFDEEEEEQQQQLLIQQTPKRSTMRNRSMSESRIFEDKVFKKYKMQV